MELQLMHQEFTKEESRKLIPSNQDMEKAVSALSGVAIETPLIEIPELADRFQLNSLHIKLESMQRTGSFKFRGAYWRCLQLSTEEKKQGVVAFSSGNFAQALPIAASLVGTSTKIVMPIDAPFIKRQRAEKFGAKVILTDHGKKGRELVAAQKAQQIAEDENRSLLHPFDDIHMITGNSSTAIEIIKTLKERKRPLPDRVFCCAGGGGLISGIAIALQRYSSKTKVVPVEPKGFDSTGQSLNKGKATTLKNSTESICDALQALRPGDVPFACLSAIETAPPVVIIDRQVCDAMALAYDLRRIVLEPAGAAPLAGLLKEGEKMKGKDIVVIASGANIQPEDFVSYIT